MKRIIPFLLLSLFFITSSYAQPLIEGMDITLRNTLQDPGAAEVTYASLFGAADDAFDEFATLSNATSEFATALAQGSAATGLPFDINGLYEIDFTQTMMKMTPSGYSNLAFFRQENSIDITLPSMNRTT